MNGPRRAIVCDHDTWERQVISNETAAAGFEVVLETTNPVETLQMSAIVDAELIVMANEHAGMMGVDAIEELRRRDDPPEILLVATDPAIRERAKELGAWDVAIRGDVAMLERMLGELRHFADTGDRRKSGDRRVGEERRVHQDWSKVTHERRSGTDRRNGDRREAEADRREGSRTNGSVPAAGA